MIIASPRRPLETSLLKGLANMIRLVPQVGDRLIPCPVKLKELRDRQQASETD